MKKIILSVLALFSFSLGIAQGLETFDNAAGLLPTGTQYTPDGSFVGNDGVTWNYIHCQSVGIYPIDGEGILLRRADEPSRITATFQGGIGNFSVDTRKGYQGNTQRKLELVINGEVVAQFQPAFANGLSEEVIPFVVNDINVEGIVNLELRMFGATGNQHIVLDNVSWTGYGVSDPCEGTPTPTADLAQTLNIGQTVGDILVNGENLTWYSDTDLTTEVEETFVLEVGTYTFYVTQTIGECTSTAIAIEVTVVDPCAGTPAPTADSPQAMTVGQTVADIAVDGENLTWYSDEDLTTEVEETFVLEEGSYTFYVTQTIGECTSEAIEVVVEVSLSTGGFDVMSFKAYPNPVKDIFTISYSKNIADVTVVNMLGQIVVKQTVQSTDAQINMSALPAGNYVVKVVVDGAVQTLKVVKQ